MSSIFRDSLAIIAMLIIAAILGMCITKNIDSGLLYSGLTLLAGLGGYSVGRILTKK